MKVFCWLYVNSTPLTHCAFVVCFSPGKSFHFRSKFNFGKNGPRATADVANSLLCRRWFKHRFRFTNSYVFQCLDLTGCGDGGLYVWRMCLCCLCMFVHMCLWLRVVCVSVSYVHVCTYACGLVSLSLYIHD